MGLGKIVKSVAKAVTAPVAAVGGLLGIGGGGESPQDQQVSQANEAVKRVEAERLQKKKELTQKFIKEASTLRANVPQYKSEAMSAAEDSSRRNLARSLSSVDKAASSRGMLYSGLRERGKADELSDYYSGLSSEREKINQQAEDLARSAEERAMGMGLETQAMGQATADAAYDRALQERLAKQEARGQMGAAAGGLLGTILGGSKK